MSADATYTEREVVLRERAAFALAAGRYAARPDSWVTEVAAIEFPLPKVTRPRKEKDPLASGISWRCVYGFIEWSGDASLGEKATWQRYPDTRPEGLVRAIYPTTARLTLMLDLLERPTEEVEDAS